MSTAQDIIDDIDRRGNNLSVFCQKAFRAGIHAGMSFILVEYSRVESRSTTSGIHEYYDRDSGSWQPMTMDAATKKGWRPYWVLVEAASVIDAWEEDIGGAPMMTHFRYAEYHVVDDGEWSRKVVKKIRVLEPGAWYLYSEPDKKSGWVLEDSGQTGLPMIPVAVFMPGEQLSEFTARPALQGLAELCEKHWQASSGHRHLMDWTRRPAYFGKCLSMSDDSEIKFGPNHLTITSDPNGDLRSVGVDQGSVNASLADLQKIESEMALYGLQLMKPQFAQSTATQSVLESAEANSSLKRWAKQFEDCVDRAFSFTAFWMGLTDDDAVAVELNTEFAKVFDGQIFSVLLQSLSAGVLPKEMIYDAIKSQLPVRDDLSWEDARQMIESDSYLISPSSQAVTSALRHLKPESEQAKT